MRGKKRYRMLALFLALGLGCAACTRPAFLEMGGDAKEKEAGTPKEEKKMPGKDREDTKKPEKEKPKKDWVEQKLEEMTLEEKAAQLFFITPEALTGAGQAVAAGETTKACLEAYPVGGLIYFTSNIQSREQIQEMLRNSKQYAKDRNGIPLLTGIDEEGGTVARAAASRIADIPKIENMSEIGASGNYERALEVGRTLGGYLREMGFNIDFAPVADVLTNPSNTVVKYRSFGEDKNLVSDMVLQELKGLHQSRILGAVKHFPGHGATAADTHQGYAYTDKTLDELLENELVPFKRAIENGVQVIMAGHISVPAITGNDEPSSLSYQMITDVLRGRLGFQGVVITDAMNMGAISQKYTSAESAVRVIQAGGDMILMPSDFKSAYEGILEAVESGRITEERLDGSVRRILRLKRNLLEEIR